MTVYDEIHNVPIECPKCGDEALKSVLLIDQRWSNIDGDLHFDHDFGKNHKKSLVLRLHDRYDFAQDNKIRGLVRCHKCLYDYHVL